MDLSPQALSDPEEDISRLLAHEDQRHALEALSIRFLRERDFRYLLACARLLRHFEPYLAYHHDALWRIIGSTATGDEGDRAALRQRIMYEELGPSYLRVAQRLAESCRFPPRLPHASARRRMLYVAHVIKPGDHSPSMEAFAFSLALERQFDLDIMLLDARTFPEERASDFVGALWQHTNRAAGFGHMTAKNRSVLTYTASQQGMSTDKISECVRAALQFNPDYVISQGNCNLIGDILASHFPTVCMEMSRAEPISRAQAFVLFEDIVRELRLPKTGLLPHMPKIHRLRSIMPVRDKGVSYTRAQFGLAADQIVYVVVGYRLPVEITDAFEAVMARILECVPRSVILTVGVRREYRHPALKAMPERLPHIDFESELRALLALCDCYLNPPRQGGGTSALIALNEDVPVLTLANSDVGGVVGAEHAVADLDALGEQAIRIGLDPATRTAARAEARDILATAPRFEQIIEDLWNALTETREHFEIERARGGLRMV